MENSEKHADKQTHWEKVYEGKGIEDLNWSQNEATPSLYLIDQCNLRKDDTIIDIGSGASVLIKNLVERGFLNVIANDISENALVKSQGHLSGDAEKVRWVVDDVTHPQKLQDLGKVSLWHDRAVFHFLTHFKERLNYFSLMNQLVKEEGYVILSAFNLDAPDHSSGLAVRKYNEDALRHFMGPGYKLIEAFNKNEQAPNGTELPYIYALFQRIPHLEME